MAYTIIFLCPFHIKAPHSTCIFQNHWLDGRPVSVAFWSMDHTDIENVKYAASNMSGSTHIVRYLKMSDITTDEYYSSLKSEFKRLSNDHIIFNVTKKSRRLRRMLDASVELLGIYRSQSWDLVYTALSKVQPEKNVNCTIAVFNPMSDGQLEWVRIPCNVILYSSNIVCQSYVDTLSKDTEVVMFADSRLDSNDHELNESEQSTYCRSGKYLVFFRISCTGDVQIYNESKTNGSLDMETYYEFGHKVAKYICQKANSSSNNWIYICLVRQFYGIQIGHSNTSAVLKLDRQNLECLPYQIRIEESCFELEANVGDTLGKFIPNSNSRPLHTLTTILNHYSYCQLSDCIFNNTGVDTTCLNNIKLQHLAYIDDNSSRQFEFYCQDRHWVSDLTVLNGDEDCPDGSDEDRQWVGKLLCQNYGLCNDSWECSYHFYTCGSGECISWSQHCDGVYNCDDQSDEDHCPIIIDSSTLLTSHLSLTVHHCANTEGETTIPINWVDDLIPDCPESDDEMGFITLNATCKNPSELACLPGHPKCFPFSKLCVFDHNTYGHIMYCRNGAHLAHCTDIQCSTRFKCPGSYCIPFSKLCDNVNDCPNGEDERCNGTLSCPGMFRCRGSVCIHPVEVCDGREDCPNGEDELLCSRAKCPVYCHCFGQTISCNGFLTEINLNQYKSAHFDGLLSSVPELKYCFELINFILANSSLTILEPHTFRSCVNLRYLKLENTGITSIQGDAFGGLQELTTLIILYDYVTVIEPNAFSGLANLPNLSLSGMHIMTINPFGFSGLDSLTYLNLSDNKITEFPKGILETLPHLGTLDVNLNPIQTVSQANIEALTMITLDGPSYLCCYFESFKCSFHFLRSLCTETLSFSQTTVFIIYGLLITSGNIFILIIIAQLMKGKRKYLVLEAVTTFTFDSLQGVYILMVMLKDPLFDYGVIHHSLGMKHMWCLFSSHLQVLAAMFVAATKGVQAYRVYRIASSVVVNRVLGYESLCQIGYHSLYISIIIILTILHLQVLDPNPMCCFLSLITSRSAVVAALPFLVTLHNALCHIESIICTYRVNQLETMSQKALIALGARVSGRNVDKHKILVRKVTRPVVALCAEMYWFGVGVSLLINPKFDNYTVIIGSFLYSFPALVNIVIYGVTRQNASLTNKSMTNDKTSTISAKTTTHGLAPK